MKTKIKKIEIPEGNLEYKISDENIELTSMFIRPEQRRKGHGGKLVQNLVDMGKEEKKACIYCFVRKSNKEAQKFYEANGFERICDILGFYRSEEAIMFIRKL